MKSLDQFYCKVNLWWSSTMMIPPQDGQNEFLTRIRIETSARLKIERFHSLSTDKALILRWANLERNRSKKCWTETPFNLNGLNGLNGNQNWERTIMKLGQSTKSRSLIIMSTNSSVYDFIVTGYENRKKTLIYGKTASNTVCLLAKGANKPKADFSLIVSFAPKLSLPLQIGQER